GAERWREYLASQGIRYLAFVDGSYSTYLYRRREWLHRVLEDNELWGFMATHMIEAQDTFCELAESSQGLFDHDGVVALDLGEARPPTTGSDPPESQRQDDFVRRLSQAELGDTAWQLASRSDVVFEVDGLGPSAVELEPLQEPSPAVEGLFAELFGAR